MPATVNREASRRLLGECTAGAHSRSHSLSSSDPDGPSHSVISLPQVIRTAVAITPRNRGVFIDQASEVLALLDAVVEGQSPALTVTAQTVFLRTEAEQLECGRLFQEHFGERMPLTHFVLQPPCSGAALAVEAWAVGGEHVALRRHSPRALSASKAPQAPSRHCIPNVQVTPRSMAPSTIVS